MEQTFSEYSERLKSPDLNVVVAEVLRELLLIGRSKELSFGERRLLEQAMSLVSGELSEVLGIPFDDLKDELFCLLRASSNRRTNKLRSPN